LPLHRSGPWSARGIPIRFEEVSSVKKPGRKAGEDAWKIYKQEVKQRNLSRRFVQSMAELRATFDRAGAPKKVLVIVGPSCLDLSALLRKEAQQHPALLETLGFQVSSSQMIAAAAA